MKIEVIHPQTRETIQVEINEKTPQQLAELLQPRASLGQVRQQVDNLPFSRDVKALLGRLATLTLEIGGVVLHLGHKLLELVFALVRRYPNTVFYTLVGYALGSLISAIPLLGWLLGWLVLPLFTALGLVVGAWSDFQAQQLRRHLQEVIKTVNLQAGVDYQHEGGDR